MFLLSYQVSTLTDIQEWHGTPFAFSRKRKSRNDSLSSEDQNKRKSSISLKSALSRANGVYEVGPPAWIKEISTRMIRAYIVSTIFKLMICSKLGIR